MNLRPAFIGKCGTHFYEGQSVRGYLIVGPTTLMVIDGQILFSPERGWFKLFPWDRKGPSRFLYDFDRLEAV